MAPLVQKRSPLPKVVGLRYSGIRILWPIGRRHRLLLSRRLTVSSTIRSLPPLRHRLSIIYGSPRRRRAVAISAAPLRAPLQTRGPAVDDALDQSSWRQNPSGDCWERQPLEPQSGSAGKTPYGGVLFEAEQADTTAERPEADAADALLRRHTAMLSTLDSLKREDFAVGVIALALGVGVAQVTVQVAQGSSAAVRGLGAGLTRSQAMASERARLWLNALEQDMRKQAAVSQESLKEWPDLVQASVARFTERETAALQQLRSNVSEWADDMPETIPGVNGAVQSLWQSAAAAARRFQAQVQGMPRSAVSQGTHAAPAPASREQLEAPLERYSTKLLEQPKQAAEPVGSLPARTLATAGSSIPNRPDQAVLPPAQAPAVAALLPVPKEHVPRKAGRSDTQVYAAEAEAQAAKPMPEPVEPAAAKHGGKSLAKQAEDVWNERIKGAYAAVAASTPYRPAPKKPSSNALSWHRGGNTTLLKPDFQIPRMNADEASSGSGSGSDNTGGSGGSGGGGDDAGDPDQEPEQDPRMWLWGRVLLSASAAAAAAEQALQWPRRRARLLALLAAAGFLAFRALESQKTGGRRNRRKAFCNSMGGFEFGGSRMGAAGMGAQKLVDFSDDDSF